MNPTLELILTILLVVIGVVMTVMILMQNSKSEGLSASLSGAAETFFGKNKGRSVEAKLQRGTLYLAIVFFLILLILLIF
ncbi:MAG: preprotein translocase subunit SecG [Oscillospiraceae bacterium]|nr:preprotein translocase subunit SecG [Oscillospiraceae bacterium]MBQ1705188.1 preprotein translocase subunit SecG [Clostridia bacterium]